MKIESAGSLTTANIDLQGQKSMKETGITTKGVDGADLNDLKATQMTSLEKNALPVSERFLIDSIEKANKAVMGANTRFEFSIHDKTKEIIVKVLNADTGDLIREIPSEKILDIVAGIWKAAGLFVDEKR